MFLPFQLEFSLMIVILLSSENYGEMLDDEVLPTMPSDYWLKDDKIRCLLAYMVHCSNKELGVVVEVLLLG